MQDDYSAAVVLGERDPDGGFGEFLRKLWEIVDDKVKAAAVGSVGGLIGGALGGIVGAVVGAVIGALASWLIAVFDDEDDHLGTAVINMTLGAHTDAYYDWARLNHPAGWTHHLNCYGGTAHYRVGLAWKVLDFP